MIFRGIYGATEIKKAYKNIPELHAITAQPSELTATIIKFAHQRAETKKQLQFFSKQVFILVLSIDSFHIFEGTITQIVFNLLKH